MAGWNVKCPHCSQTIRHSDIPDTFTNYFWPERPSLPEDGQSMTCEGCGKTSLYKRNDLTFDGKSSNTAALD